MAAIREHSFKPVLPLLTGVFLLIGIMVVAPAGANAGFFDSILGTSNSPFVADKPAPRSSPKAKPAAQKVKSPKPQVAKKTSEPFLSKIDFPKISLPNIKLGSALAAVGDALWPFDDVKKGKPVASDSKSKQTKQAQVLGEKDSKGPGFFSKVFRGIGNTIAGVFDFLWPFDGKRDLAKKDGDKGKAQQASPVPSAAPSAEDEVVTELAQTGEEDAGVVVATASELSKLTVTGNTILGDASSDTISVKGRFDTDLLPATANKYSLGASENKWKTAYVTENVYIGGTTFGIGGITFEKDGVIGTKDGSAKSLTLDSDSGILYLGPGTNQIVNSDNSQPITIDPNGSNQINFHSSANFITSAGNMTIAGTLTATGGATSSDSIDITPSTNIDALDIIGTNITTADLIDLDATATTTGDAIDINMANTRTSGSAILITDESVAATVTGDLIQINVTGTPDTNTLDIDLSAAASGNLVDLTTTAVVFTGNYVDINVGSAAQTGDVFNTDIGALAVALQYEVVTNAAISSTAGWLMDIDTTAAWTGDMIDIVTGAQAWTGNMFDVDVGAAASTGDVFNVSMGSSNLAGGAYVVADAGGARTDALIDITSASTGDGTDAAALLQLNSTGVLLSGSNILDINRSGAASNAIDITTLTTASAGNLIDLNFGAILDTGDAINIALGTTATGTQALVVTAANASTVDGWVLAADNTADSIWTGDMINIRTGTGDASGDIIDITMEAGATDAQAFVVANAAASDQAGWLMKVDTTGIFTTNMIDIDLGAQLSTGDIMNVSMGSTNVGGGVLVVADAGGARTDALIDITSASTGDGTDASALLQLNSTGVLLSGSNILDINRSGAASNAIDITTLTTASAGNLIDLNFGAILDTGDAINVAMGSTAVGAQALVVASSGVSTVDLIDISSTGAVITAQDLMQLAYTAGDGTDVTQSVLHTQLTTSGAGLAATDIAAGILVEQVSEAGSGTERGIMFSGGWDAEIYLQNTETISNVTDDSIVLTGAGGTNNESFTIDLDSVASSGATLSSGGTFVLVNDNLSVGIDGNTTENIASSDFAFSGNDLYVDDKLGVNGTASIDGNLWQGDAVTTTTKTTAFLFLGTTAGAPTGDPATPVGFASIVYDTTNNKLCADEEAAGAAWLCTGALVDIAEWMPAAGAESGDLVSVTDLANPVDDPTAPFMLAKTTKPYDNKLVGVISKYAEDAESALGYKRSADYHAVTLVGRVPVKVSGGNGPIAKGDYLTSSSTPGHAIKATKAGPVVGMALESFSGETGSIMVFVKAAYYDPVAAQKAAVLSALGMGSYPPLYGQVLGASTAADTAGASTATGATGGTSSLVGPAADGSLGVLEEAADLMVYGLLTANNLKVTTAAEFAGTLVVKGLATFEGDLVVKGALSLGSLDIAGALTKTMTAGSDISAGDPVAVSGANTVVRAGAGANVVGLAASGAGAGGSVRVALAGTVGGYSGLATGSRYYVGAGGVVTTAPGGDRAVHIGIAVSGSEMIVQIFEAAAPPAPPVVDTATVDPGPTVTVPEGTGGTDGQGGTGTESTPTASPSPEPSSAPSPAPSVEPSPVPSPTPTPSPTP